MSDQKISRRGALRALATAGAGLCLGGCLVPARPPPRIAEPRGALGGIPWRRTRALPGLWAGAASIDITPPDVEGTFLAGFGFQRRARTMRDPLEARCLYLDDGVHRVALVVADVVGLMAPTVRRVRKLVGNDIEVAVISTHNHQGPDTMGYWGPAALYALPYKTGIRARYLEALERRLAAVVANAARRASPAQLACARAQIPAGVVRNLRRPGFWDPAVEVVELVDDLSRTPIATLVNFGCHPETLGDHGRALSADFPGRLRTRLHRARGGTPIFINGALGGMITPELDDDLDVAARSKLVDHLGDTMADVALQALAGVTPIDVGAVRYRRREVELPTDNEVFRYVERVGLVEPRARGAGQGFLTEVGRIDLGPASFALVPGEPTPTVGLRIKERLGAQHPLVVGLANDELGYVLDPAQYDDEEYAYERSVSMGREAAPRIEAAIASL